MLIFNQVCNLTSASIFEYRITENSINHCFVQSLLIHWEYFAQLLRESFRCLELKIGTESESTASESLVLGFLPILGTPALFFRVPNLLSPLNFGILWLLKLSFRVL